MELKNSFSQGKMNKDLDERLVPNGEYIDALNIRVGKSANGDVGAIENEKGNVKVTSIDTANNPICIGSTRDEANEKLYWFVVNDNGHSFVYEYDNKNDITSLVLADTRNGSDQVLGFNKDYKITGANVVYNKETQNTILLFTDNLNHPRMVNVARAKAYGANNFSEEDINLYKKPPRTAPTVQPFKTGVEIENSVRERHFAFAYRYKYLDGQYSALSSFTDYKFYPNMFSLDFTTMENLGMLNEYNAYDIKYNTGDKRVTDIQLCFKTPLSDVVFVIDTINKQENNFFNDTERSYTFTNTKVYKALPDDELNRIFDNVPLRALAQDIIQDRVIFGNYTTQYDIKENETDELTIPIDYTAEKRTILQDGEEGDYTITTTQDAATNKVNIVLDFTGISLRKGYRVFISSDVESFTSGTTPAYFDGSFQGNSSVILSQNFADANAFYASTDFDELLLSMSADFANNVTTTSPPNTTSLAYGNFTKTASTATSITVSAPIITHTTSGGDEIERYRWTDATVFAVSENASKLSLKSNRNYDFGLVYLDKYGRYSSVLPNSDDNGSDKSNFFVPVEDSVNFNKARITIKNKAPYWADRYKFFVKSNKGIHYNLYATTVYQDDLYRWVLLNGNNADKVEAGMNLLVKSDDDGPLAQEVKVKVLEVTTKAGNDVVESAEGWLIGNRDSADNPIKEIQGRFMKIRPSGFKMTFDPNNFFTYDGKGVEFFTYPQTNVPEDNLYGLLSTYNGTSYDYYDLPAGSKIYMKFHSWDTQDRDGDEVRYFEQEYTVQNDYAVGGLNPFEKWLDAETNWTKPAGQSYYVDPKGQFHLSFVNVAHSVSNVSRVVLNVESTEDVAFPLERGKIECTITIQRTNGVVVFETDPDDLDADVYYETEQVFEIENGYHIGNTQAQTSSQDAIVDLDFGNCYSFGNGVESVSVRDARFASALQLDLRPNVTLLQGYRETTETNGLIFSGSANENTGYNTLNEFNAARGNTKYMDMKYGSIQHLFARETDLLVFQEDQVSKVLYGKSLLHTADGNVSLTQVESVLGQTVPYAGEYGISKNPESFSEFEGRVYFTDATRGSVLRLSQDGITPISAAGMEGYFRENLTLNIDKYNVGGFDPKYGEYVLSYNSAAKLAAEVIYDCSSQFNRVLAANQSYSYKLSVGDNPGTLTLAYSVSGQVDISVSYDGNTTTQNNVTGSGNMVITISSANLANTKIAEVTVTADQNSEFDITHTCPIAGTREVIVVVLNDVDDADKTIINRYKVGSANYYARTDVFSDTGVARNETLVESGRNPYIPESGATITLSSYKQWGYHTGFFNSCSRFGYLVSDAVKTTTEVQEEATYITETTDSNDIYKEVTGTFTFSPTSDNDKLYIIFDYQDGNCTPIEESEGLDEGQTDVGNTQ